MLQELKKEYVNASNTCCEQNKRDDDCIQAKRETIKRLESQVEKINRKRCEHPRWTQYIVRPIFEEIERRYSFLEVSYYLAPMGLRNECWLFVNAPSMVTEACMGTVASICLTQGDPSTGEAHFDTGEKTKDFGEDTLGEINNMNNVTLPLESIDQLIELIDNKLLQFSDLPELQNR